MPNQYEIVGAEDYFGDEFGDEFGAEMEIVGQEDMGAEDLIIGARRRGRPSPQRQMARRRFAAGKPVARPRQVQGGPLKVEVLPLPSSGSVAAGGTATIQAQPQRYMRVERLAVPNGFGGLLLTELKVGQESEFVAPGEIDISLFQREAIGIRLKGNTAGPGLLVTLTLLNTTAGALTLRGAAIWGAAIDP